MEAPCPKPEFKKYSKMKKIGMPLVSVRNKMKMDGIHAYWIRDFFGEPQPLVGGDDDDEEVEEEMKAPPGPEPDYKKYSKMKKIGMPIASVKNKMRMDGIHQYWQCKFLGEPIPKIKKKKSGKKKSKRRAVKPLHWRKKSDCDWTNTLWQNMSINIVIDDIKSDDKFKPITTTQLITPTLASLLEKQFTNIKPKKKVENTKKKKDEKKEITLIDPKRAFNTIVGLRQFEKQNLNDIKIRNALLKLDESKLTIEMLENLSKFVPSNEELTELRNFKGDKTKLARGEQFVDCMTCMVDIKLRINLWEFKLKFSSKVFEIEERINQVHGTLSSLKNSIEIDSFLKICLSVGNFMNEGTNRGNAKGIKLESIDRFASLKTADGKQTMLMFIMKYIYNECNKNELFDKFPVEMSKIVDSTKKIEAKTIRDGIADMKDSLERIGKRIKRANRNLHEVQKQFTKSVGAAFNVMYRLKKNTKNLSKLKKSRKFNKAKRKIIDTPTPTSSVPQTPTNADNKKIKKNKKGVTFANILDDDDDDDDEANKSSKYSKYSKYGKKPKKYIIIDDNYNGSKLKNKIYKRKERNYSKQEQERLNNDDGFDLFTRAETIIESDIDFDDIEVDDRMTGNKKKKKKNIKQNKKKSKHHRTDTLRRKKHKMKKIKIIRMIRVGKKKKQNENDNVSKKAQKTIKKLKHEKKKSLNLNIDANLLSLDPAKSETIKALSKGMGNRMSLTTKSNNKSKPKNDGKDKKFDINKPPSDKFETMMTGFHTMACNKVEALESKFKNLKIFAENTAVYFGEHDDLEWEELFKIFLNLFEQINKAKKKNDELEKKRIKEEKKRAREEARKKKLAAKGLKPKKNNIKNNKKSDEPTNILEEIKMRKAKGTLKASIAKNDVIGFEKVDKKENKKQAKKKNPMGGGMSLMEQIKARNANK